MLCSKHFETKRGCVCKMRERRVDREWTCLSHSTIQWRGREEGIQVMDALRHKEGCGG